MKDTMLDKLQKFGLNLYEAKAYSSLLEIGTANAYKIPVVESPKADNSPQSDYVADMKKAVDLFKSLP